MSNKHPFHISLAKALITTGVVCAVLALVRGYLMATPALRVVAEGGPFNVYVDELNLGASPVELSVAEASRLGFGDVSQNSKVRMTPFGAFLTDYRHADGSVPFISLRRDVYSGTGKSVSRKEAIESGRVVPLKIGMFNGDFLSLVAETEPLSNAFNSALTIATSSSGRATIEFHLPDKLWQVADAENGGVRLLVSAYSTIDGRIVHRYWELKNADAKQKVTMDLGTSRNEKYSSDQFVFVVSITGRDRKPIRGWTAFAGKNLVKEFAERTDHIQVDEYLPMARTSTDQE